MYAHDIAGITRYRKQVSNRPRWRSMALCDYNYTRMLCPLYITTISTRMLAKHSGICSHVTQSNVIVQMVYLVTMKPKDNYQLFDEVEHNIIKNYQGRGLCYLPKPKVEAANTNRSLDNSWYYAITESHNCSIMHRMSISWQQRIYVRS